MEAYKTFIFAHENDEDLQRRSQIEGAYRDLVLVVSRPQICRNFRELKELESLEEAERLNQEREAAPLWETLEQGFTALSQERTKISKLAGELESSIRAYSSKLNELVRAVETPAQPTAASTSVAERSIQLLRALDRDRTRLNRVATHLSSQLATGNIFEVTNAYRDLQPSFAQAREIIRERRQGIERLRSQEEERQRHHAEVQRERELRKHRSLAYYEPIIAKLRAEVIRETEALTKLQNRQAARIKIERQEERVRYAQYGLDEKLARLKIDLHKAEVQEPKIKGCAVCGVIHPSIKRVEDCPNFQDHGYGRRA